MAWSRFRFIRSLLQSTKMHFSGMQQGVFRSHSALKKLLSKAFGWQAEYVPQRDTPPLQSRLTFTPAEFCIGESGVWFFSLMWEHGAAESPAEFLDESGIVR